MARRYRSHGVDFAPRRYLRQLDAVETQRWEAAAEAAVEGLARVTPHYADATVTVFAGDCLDVLRELPDASVDAVVTDPPYGLEFMGKEWDAFRPARDPRTIGRSGAGVVGEVGITPTGYDDPKWRGVQRPSFSTARPMTLRCDTCGVRSPIDKKHSSKAPGCKGTWVAVPMYPDAPSPLKPFQDWCQLWAAECLRVLKPGGHLLAFGGTRTSHRLACAIEDAGFEIRDSIAWLYGSGFPKSLDVSKAIDRAAGAEREVVGPGVFAARRPVSRRVSDGGSPVGEAALHYGEGHDITAPATDDARTWQGWGTALKPAHEPVVVARRPLAGTVAANVLAHGTGALNIDGCRVGDEGGTTRGANGSNAGKPRNTLHGGNFGVESIAAGRWPANVVLDEHSAHVLDEQSGELTSGANPTRRGSDGDRTAYGDFAGQDDANPQRGIDTGGASRFFYTAKAASDERVRINGTAHPTVKPLALMRWLVRLVCPPNGVVLDPFAGSGTTVEACILEGFQCIGIEREADYLPLITQRINRRRNPVEAVKASGDDGGLFDLLEPDEEPDESPAPSGRWPTNVVLDRAAAEVLDEQSGEQVCGGNTRSLRPSGQHGGYAGDEPNLNPGTDTERGYGDRGGASRFFPVFDDEEPDGGAA